MGGWVWAWDSLQLLLGLPVLVTAKVVELISFNQVIFLSGLGCIC